MEKIQLYINGNVIINNKYADSQSVNQELINALDFMYSKWPHLMQFYFYNISEETLETMKSPYELVYYSELPKNINKLYHNIDTNYEDLCIWERNGGKSIAFDFIKSSKESWEGFKMSRDMTEEEFIGVLRKTMHLYD